MNATGAACEALSKNVSRRAYLSVLAALLLPWQPGAIQAAPLSEALADIADLEDAASLSYANREFADTVQKLNELVDRQPESPRWYEMRAQVLVDGKEFNAALQDFDTAISLYPGGSIDEARLLSGRALAWEGIDKWQQALDDYDRALFLAGENGKKPDPYVVNSRGNVRASLGDWDGARSDYLAARDGFQQARGFRGRSGGTTQRLDGAVFAASNAALAAVQLGNEEQAIKEMQAVARRAPGSADMRAALAALYWSQGQQQAAEGQWEYACDSITVGCRKYQSKEWLLSIRRWPPRMVALMQDFLTMKDGRGLQQ